MLEAILQKWHALDRIGQTRLFKVIASVLLGISSIAFVVTAWQKQGNVQLFTTSDFLPPEAVKEKEAAKKEAARKDAATTLEAKKDTGAAGSEQAMPEDETLQSTVEAFNDIISSKQDLTFIVSGTGIVAGILLVVIWLGLTFTYISIGVAGAATYAISRLLHFPVAGQLILGCVILSAAFTALLAGLRLLLSGSNPVIAIARNVLTEAVRMKASMVFIVMLVLMLAFLPQWLDVKSPLRYRVQTVLQFGTSISFWIIALLTLLLTMSSICFEQRDKIIWQTMTKPVKSWQYLLGKWVGVSGLAGVLLAVSASGVFLFTEYMRNQPALNESAPYVAAGGAGVTEDRKILEGQILVARESVRADLPEYEKDKLDKTVQQYVQNERLRDPNFGVDPRNTTDHDAIDPAVRSKVAEDLVKTYIEMYRTLEPGETERYKFSGLSEAKRIGKPLILKFRVDSGANRPDQILKLTFLFNRMNPFVREVVLGQDMIIWLPARQVIDDSGTVIMEVANGDMLFSKTPNASTLMFPKGGLELSYPVSSYRQNYLRVVLVLWVKLCFLAMVAVFCSTFMSFPVASLVSLGVFFAAETTSYLFNALEYYSTEDEGKVVYFKAIVRLISVGVANLFKAYADLKPLERLVQGELIPAQDILFGIVGLALATVLLFFIAGFIFRRRELATYSGN